MNQILLMEKAHALLAILKKHSASNSDVRALFAALYPLLEASSKCEVYSPVEWRDVPGAPLFRDGSLLEYRDLEEAYSLFKIEITGGEPLALKMFRQSRGEGKV